MGRRREVPKSGRVVRRNVASAGRSKMEADSTLDEVLYTLSDPEEYVRGMVGSFDTYKFNREQAVIRIGVSGAGIIPNYYIEESAPLMSVSVLGVTMTTNRRHEVFSGRNHSPILDHCPEGESWSSAAM